MDILEICNAIARLIRSQATSSFFLNGPPGSGKSHTLKELSEILPAQVPRSQILGPYAVNQTTARGVGARVLNDCHERVYVDSVPDSVGASLAEAWSWFLRNANLSPADTFVILIDVDSSVGANHLSELADLFSQARYLEGLFRRSDARTLILIAGFWLGTELEAHFQKISTSFPFTVGHNYVSWQGLGIDEMARFVPASAASQGRLLVLDLLRELSGGHPEIVSTIVELCQGQISVANCIESTKIAAKDSDVQRRLLSVWKTLPAESLAYLPKLILSRRLPGNLYPAHKEPLVSAGIIEEISNGQDRFLKFRSWFVELVVHLHTEELNLADERLARIDPYLLIPDISSFSIDAYRLINNIENSARNFLTIQLSLATPKGTGILTNRLRQYDRSRDEESDAESRAAEWRSRSAQNGLPTALNPLIAYVSTRDLADLFDEFGRQNDRTGFREMGQMMRQLSHIRDAIMHNQLIDEAAIGKLYQLKSKIDQALGQSGK